MRMTRKIGYLCLLLIATLFAQNAYATLAPMLPTSTYATAVGNWQGSTYYDEVIGEDHLYGRIDFAVYDTEGTMSGAEIGFVDAFATDMPQMEQYLYAYQIFNDYEEDSDKAVSYFAVFNLAETTLDVDEENIGSGDDSAGGVEPSSWSLDKDEPSDEDNSRVIWNFGGGLIYKGDHSWFLVFSTDSAPVVGDYEIRSQEPEFPVPEPGTMALFGLGGLLFFRKRSKLTV